jgi:signal transduction histidine kinase
LEKNSSINSIFFVNRLILVSAINACFQASMPCAVDSLRPEINGRGLGFDVETSSQQDWEFISMCERIEPIGGEFESWSGPGQGTRITASAPIVKQAL